jgi:hypothetical protein
MDLDRQSERQVREPNRSATPGLMEEEGLDFYFDEQDVVRESKGWGFVRPESIAEGIRRRLE